MKTTSNRRQPQNIKSGISQQPLIGSSSNFKLKLRGPTQIHKCLKWRQPPIEDDLQWKTTSKYLKLNISATTDRIFLKFETQAQGTKQKSKMLKTNWILVLGRFRGLFCWDTLSCGSTLHWNFGFISGPGGSWGWSLHPFVLYWLGTLFTPVSYTHLTLPTN